MALEVSGDLQGEGRPYLSAYYLQDLESSFRLRQGNQEETQGLLGSVGSVPPSDVTWVLSVAGGLGFGSAWVCVRGCWPSWTQGKASVGGAEDPDFRQCEGPEKGGAATAASG